MKNLESIGCSLEPIPIQWIEICSTSVASAHVVLGKPASAFPEHALTTRRRGAGLRIDFLARDRAQRSRHHDAVVSADAGIDDAQIADYWTNPDLALLDHIVLVDHQHVAPALIGTDG